MDEISISKERLLQILQTYIDTDLNVSETAVVLTTLTDICGCTVEEINQMGLGYLLPEQ